VSRSLLRSVAIVIGGCFCFGFERPGNCGGDGVSAFGDLRDSLEEIYEDMPLEGKAKDYALKSVEDGETSTYEELKRDRKWYGLKAITAWNHLVDDICPCEVISTEGLE
jgi:hypothetical protein